MSPVQGSTSQFKNVFGRQHLHLALALQVASSLQCRRSKHSSMLQEKTESSLSMGDMISSASFRLER